MGVAFAQAVLHRYCRGCTDLLHTSSVAEQSQFVPSLRANNGGGSGQSGVRSGEEELSGAVVVEEVNEED